MLISARRGSRRLLARPLRRRSAIEPEIGYRKTDGRLTRCPRKGATGDGLSAVRCACGHNTRKILAHLRALLALPIAARLAAVEPRKPHPTGAAGP